MIATTVLSIMLVLISVIIINIGNLYSKGINQSKVQDNARSIVDELVQGLQINNPGSVQVGANAICINNVRYSYVLHQQLAPNQHVLWRDVPSSLGSACPSANLSLPTPTTGDQGTELMIPGTRLANLTVQKTQNPNGEWYYVITFREVFGANDLLCSPTATPTNDCNLTTTSTALNNTDLQCKGFAGEQFCAVSALTTTATARVEQ